MSGLEILKSRNRLAEGRDYHRKWLDKYLPDGLIGDIGCGNGRIALVYENATRRFISIDTDAEMIATLQQMFPEQDWRVGDATGLPIEDGSLDAYIGLGIFELAGEQAAAEAARVLKPGGLLYATVPYCNRSRQNGAKAKWRGIEVPSFSKSEIADFLRPFGFGVTTVRRVSLAWGNRWLSLLSRLFVQTLEDEDGWLYERIGHRLRPYANSLLVVATLRDHERPAAPSSHSPA